MGILDAGLPTLIRQALQEDVGTGDVTSDATIESSHQSSGWMIAKQDGVLSGLTVAEAVFKKVDPRIEMQVAFTDRSLLQTGDKICRISGPTKSILSGERVALNFLQHLSGIATRTAQFVEKVSNTDVQILDTRKTTPCMRRLEKTAVVDGGGVNHRLGLYDAVMIKDNHVDAAGGIKAAISCLKRKFPHGMDMPVIVEVRNLEELKEALIHEPDRVLLDNFTSPRVKEAVKVVHQAEIKKTVEIEVSGGITLETVASFALPGVNYISVGSLTHSAPAFDISLNFDRRV